MIFGAHVVLDSKDAPADRAFLRDILGLSSVDAGHGWLIFALPPAEAAVHPAEENGRHEPYFMCDDLQAEISALAARGAACSEVREARWGQSPISGSPAEARSVSTNRSIQRRYILRRNERRGPPLFLLLHPARCATGEHRRPCVRRHQPRTAVGRPHPVIHLSAGRAFSRLRRDERPNRALFDFNHRTRNL